MFVYRKRRRYRFTRHPEYQLLHYIRMQNEPSTVPVQLHLAKIKPRVASTLPQARPMPPAMAQMPGQQKPVSSLDL